MIEWYLTCNWIEGMVPYYSDEVHSNRGSKEWWCHSSTIPMVADDVQDKAKVDAPVFGK